MMPSKKSIKDLVKERRATAKKALSSKKAKRKGSSQSSSLGMPFAPQAPPPTKNEGAPSTERIPHAVYEHCIKDYKILMAFEEDVTNIVTTAFIFGFEDYKARLWWMMLQLDLHYLLPDNNDEEVGAFSSDEE